MTLLVTFKNEIAVADIPLFRGAVISAAGGDSLLHNHNDGGFFYRYPIIQYKRVHQKAALFAIEDGIDQVAHLLNLQKMDLRIGERNECFEVDKVLPSHFIIQVWETTFDYYLNNWIALNQENYVRYTECRSVADKALFLQKILTANILSLCKGLGITLEKQVVCEITKLDEPHGIRYKKMKMMGFDVEFTCNVSLPNYIGVGKAVSNGFGTIVRKTTEK